MIEEIKDAMKDWFAFELTDEQIKEYLKETPIKWFDTVEREDYAEYLGKKITGMSFPMNGDSDEYKKNFYEKLKVNSENMGYAWNNAT